MKLLRITNIPRNVKTGLQPIDFFKEKSIIEKIIIWLTVPSVTYGNYIHTKQIYEYQKSVERRFKKLRKNSSLWRKKINL